MLILSLGDVPDAGFGQECVPQGPSEPEGGAGQDGGGPAGVGARHDLRLLRGAQDAGGPPGDDHVHHRGERPCRSMPGR